MSLEYLRVSIAIYQHPPTISYGVAGWKWKKWEMDAETQRKSRAKDAKEGQFTM